jgi:peptidoglycan/xylan/chitin deacetylase (PgdA/CDA1 family)
MIIRSNLGSISMHLNKHSAIVTRFSGGAPARPGTLMLSFDSEGKWGLADCLTDRHDRLYTTQNLETAYGRLTGLLEKYRIEATFAFTAAFTLTADEFEALTPDLAELIAEAAPWITSALAGIRKPGSEGWFGSECFDKVRHAGCHEIASHGFSHLPWKAPYASRAALDAELTMCRKVAAFSRDAVTTFVFPRNQIAHLDLLTAHGFLAYRESRSSHSRAANLASEFNMLSRSEAYDASDEVPVPVPAGRFLNWRHGLRRCVPAAVTVRRWQNMLRESARSGGIVHAWTHPENFMDGKGMFPMLEEILRFAADERDAGRLQIMTIADFLTSRLDRTTRELSSAVC